MKHKPIRPVVFLAFLLQFWQTEAQTNIVRYTGSANTDYGVVYALPSTCIALSVLTEKESFTPGLLAPYSAKYLGIEAKQIAETTCRIADIRIDLRGEADKDHTYVVAFRPGTVAPYVYLNDRGLICGINAGIPPADEAAFLGEPGATKELPPVSPIAPPTIEPSLPQDYAMATSTAKQAEIAAAYLYDIRESLLDLMKGNVEAMPKDGEAMKMALNGLRNQEAATSALFTGKSAKQNFWQTIYIQPDSIDGRVIARFSSITGLTSAEDLSGEPLTMTLKVVENNAPATEEEAEKSDKKLKGIIYNLPGLADITVAGKGKVLCRKRLALTQLGCRRSLTPNLFKPKGRESVQVVFNPETGAIVRISGSDH